MKAAIYSRKSVYTGKGESIENQIEMCRQYIFAKLNGVGENDITVYEDEGFSAKNTDRPQFQKLLKDLGKKKYDYVVCYRLDRISRNVGDFAVLIESLNRLGVSFICIKEEFDTSKPMGKAMMFIASVFAQLERETLAERVRDNMFMLARTGRWLGGTAPTGFISERTEDIFIDGKVKTVFQLAPDQIEIATVRIIFDKFLELGSLSGVSKFLINSGVKSRIGKYYSLPGIKQILENPVYCVADDKARDFFMSCGSDVCFGQNECSDTFGLLSYNKRDHKKKNAPRQDKSEWIIAVGRHKGIIPSKQWTEVQNILETNKPKNRAVRVHNGYSLLSGAIVCSLCGDKMFAKQRRCADGLFDYICSSKLRGGAKLCPGKNLNGVQTDAEVWEYLSEFIAINTNIFKIFDKLKKDLQANAQPDPLTEINAKINKNRAETDSLITTLLQQNLNQVLIDRINHKAAELDSEIKRLEAEKESIQNNISNISSALDKTAEALSDFTAYFNELTIHEKRIILKMLFRKIEWDGRTLRIYRML